MRILTEPKNALIKQYIALLDTEGLKLNFTEDAIATLARYAVMVNEQTENIGARRLRTILEKSAGRNFLRGAGPEEKECESGRRIRHQAAGRHREESGPQPVHPLTPW